MHISAILLLDTKGEIILSRFYRDDVSEQVRRSYVRGVTERATLFSFFRPGELAKENERSREKDFAR